MLTIYFFFKQKTAYEIWRDWSSDVCSSDLGMSTPASRSSSYSSSLNTHTARSGPPWYLRLRWRSPSMPPAGTRANITGKIGRASGRERGEISVGAGALKKKVDGLLHQSSPT